MIIRELEFRYTGYSHREWFFCLCQANGSINPVPPVNYEVGEFLDPLLKEQFYIKRNGCVWTATYRHEDVLRKLRVDVGIQERKLRDSYNNDSFNFTDRVDRTWTDIMKD